MPQIDIREGEQRRRVRVWPIYLLVAAAVLLVVLRVGMVGYREAAARAELEALGGRVFETEDWLPQWVPRPVAMRIECLTSRVVSVGMHRTSFASADERRRSVECLLQFPDLEYVLLLGRYSDDDLRPLSRLLKLKTVWLFDCSVTSAGLQHLLPLRNLTELDLWSTDVDDAGLAVLAKLPQLETLALDGTRVTDAGLVHLRGLSRLRELSASDTDISEAGIEELQRALPGLQVHDD